MSFEIAINIGCPMKCKYCAQEIIVKKHHKMGQMAFEQFKRYISDVPKEESVNFGGIAEPFLNPDAVEMIVYTHEKGHTINLFTTLVGLKPADANRLVKIPFNAVMLHLPDAEGNACIPATPEYFECLYIFFTNVHNLRCMNMGKNFISNHNEDVLRGTSKIQRNDRIMCPNLTTRAYMLFPDGTVSLCCMMRGMEGIIGNLNTETYLELIAKFDAISIRYQKDVSTMCHRCSTAENYWWYHLKIPISKVLNHPKIIALRNEYGVFPVVEQFVNQID